MATEALVIKVTSTGIVTVARNLKNLGETAAKAEGYVKNLQNALDKANISSSFMDAVKSLAQFQEGMNRSAKAVQQLQQHVNALARANANVGTAAARANAQSQRAFSSMRTGALGALAPLRLLQRELAGVGLAIGILQAARAVGTFEQSMATLNAVAAPTIEDLARLREEALRLGSTTIFDPTKVGEGMVELARAGFDVNEVMASTGPILLAAQAGAVEFSRAAEITVGVLTGFGREASSAQQVVDVLTKTANDTATSFGELGTAMSYVAPIANSMNVSLEETAAILGVLAQGGLKGQRGGTGLRRVFASLEAPDSNQQKVLQRYGIELREVQLTAVGAAEAMQRLNKANLSPAAKLQLFGKIGAPAANILLQERNLKLVADLQAGLISIEDYTKKVAAAMNAGPLAAFQRLTAAAKAFSVQVADSGLGTALVKAMNLLAATLRGVADNLLLSATAAGVAGFAYLGLTGVVTKMVSALWLAQGAVHRLNLAIARNPAGALAIGLAAVLTALTIFRKEIKFSEEGVATLNDALVMAGEGLKQAFNFGSYADSGIGNFFRELRVDLHSMIGAAAAVGDVLLTVASPNLLAQAVKDGRLPTHITDLAHDALTKLEEETRKRGDVADKLKQQTVDLASEATDTGSHIQDLTSSIAEQREELSLTNAELRERKLLQEQLSKLSPNLGPADRIIAEEVLKIENEKTLNMERQARVLRKIEPGISDKETARELLAAGTDLKGLPLGEQRTAALKKLLREPVERKKPQSFEDILAEQRARNALQALPAPEQAVQTRILDVRKRLAETRQVFPEETGPKLLRQATEEGAGLTALGAAFDSVQEPMRKHSEQLAALRAARQIDLKNMELYNEEIRKLGGSWEGITRQYNEQVRLLNMSNDQRSVELALIAQKNAKGGPLSQKEQQAVVDGEANVRVLTARNDILQQYTANQEKFRTGVQALTVAQNENNLSAEQARVVMRDLELAVLATDRSMQGGLRRALLQMQQDFSNTGAMIEGAFTNVIGGIENTLVSFVTTGKLSFNDLANSILADLTRIAFKAAILKPLMGLGLSFLDYFSAPAANTGVLSGLGRAGSLGTVNVPGEFATGGSFLVGGGGGTDSTPVSFWATPGERVTVQTPNQQARADAGGGGGSPIVQNFNIYTQDANSFRASQGQIMSRSAAAASRARKRGT